LRDSFEFFLGMPTEPERFWLDDGDDADEFDA